MAAEVDLVIPAHPKDLGILDVAVECALRNLPEVRRIHVVSRDVYSYDSQSVHHVPEPAGDPLPGVDEIRDRWLAECSAVAWRAGWLYQQLLCLGAAEYIDDLPRSFVCLDADTLFLRPVRFVFEGARFVYYDSPQPPRREYAETHRRLTGEEQLPRSFTAHHMLFDQALLAELFAQIEQLHGKPWHAAILDSVDYSVGASFGEWDTYGSWVMTHHPDLCLNRPLSWMDIRYLPNRFGRRRLARRFDFVSAHTYMRQPLAPRIAQRAQTTAGRILRRIPGAGRIVRSWQG